MRGHRADNIDREFFCRRAAQRQPLRIAGVDGSATDFISTQLPEDL